MKPTIAIDNEYIERWKKEGGKAKGKTIGARGD